MSDTKSSEQLPEKFQQLLDAINSRRAPLNAKVVYSPSGRRSVRDCMGNSDACDDLHCGEGLGNTKACDVVTGPDPENSDPDCMGNDYCCGQWEC